MKNLNYLIFLIVSIIIFTASCTKEQSEISDDTNIVKVESRQDAIPGFVYPTPCEASEITIWIDPDQCGGTVYEDAIHEAIAAYENTPTALGFVEIDNEWEADIIIVCLEYSDADCGDTDVFFQSTDPWHPEVSDGVIQLFMDWEYCMCTDENSECGFEEEIPDCLLKRAVMKSLGFALGLHHNGEGNYIDGTPDTTYDPGSIFNDVPVIKDNCEWCNTCEFTEGDIEALQSLYPADDLDLCDKTCYCECLEEDYGAIGEYDIVREVIDCFDPRSCDEIFGGDPLFDCKRISE